MSNTRRRILRSRIDDLQIRWKRLTHKLNALTRQRDLETRIEERLRLEAIINEAETDRLQIAADIEKRENELSSLSNSFKPRSQKIERPTGSIEVFYSYAREDETLRERLEKHLNILKRQGLINDWHDRKISPGTEWECQIDTHMETAHIILLLISPNFIASDYCWDKELRCAMKRHESGEAVVIPIILSKTDWQGAPFEKLQALPQDAKPVACWENQDAAFADIAEGIRMVAEQLAVSHTKSACIE
jgi:hypothetical protein